MFQGFHAFHAGFPRLFLCRFQYSMKEETCLTYQRTWLDGRGHIVPGGLFRAQHLGKSVKYKTCISKNVGKLHKKHKIYLNICVLFIKFVV